MISLSPDKLKRYKDIILLIIKYGRQTYRYGRMVEAALPGDEGKQDDLGDTPEQFVNALEELGPTFIKLGQLLSTRPDFLPPEYIEALSRLQDKVGPFPFTEVEEIVGRELGVRLSKAFSEFESEPIAAASLGQVHRAKLRDGKQVAVKVQRPGIRETVLKDLDALHEIATSADKYTDIGRKFSFSDILNEFRRTLLQELDYLQEAQNLIKLNRNLARYDSILIPQPVNDYSTSRVLTMDLVRGIKVTSLSPVAHLEMDGMKLAEDLFKAYLDQVLVDGFFHADPHPGNVFITDDKRIALIDLGMVARIDPDVRESIIKLLLCVSDGRGTEAAETGLELGSRLEDFNKENYLKQVKEIVVYYQDVKLEHINVGRVIIELTRIAGANGFRTAPELMLLGKTLLNLDRIGKTLEPKFDPNATIRAHAERVLRGHLFKSLSAGILYSSLLETRELIQKLPVRLNAIMEVLASNRLELRVKAFDELRLMENLQKIANRIALGLILAALIIGAALMMNTKSTFTILGYPGIAMLMFVGAAACGFGLVFNILLKDEWRRNKK